jgi:hypothetical protein
LKSSAQLVINAQRRRNQRSIAVANAKRAHISNDSPNTNSLQFVLANSVWFVSFRFHIIATFFARRHAKNGARDNGNDAHLNYVNAVNWRFVSHHLSVCAHHAERKQTVSNSDESMRDDTTIPLPVRRTDAAY